MCAFRNANSEGVCYYWDAVSGEIVLDVDGVEKERISIYAAGLAQTDVWHDLGFTYKKSLVTGFTSLYINGERKMNWVGDVPDAIDNVVVHMAEDQGWQNFAYYDDLYVDNIDGELDSSPNSVYFLHVLPTGVGANSAWTPVGAATNWQSVDDPAANDGDTTYVKALAAALRDTYVIGDIVLPADFSVAAVIPYAMVKRLDAGTDSQIKLTLFDGAIYADGDAQTGLPTGYGYRATRFALQPDGSAWNEADFNSMQSGLLSAGTF